MNRTPERGGPFLDQYGLVPDASDDEVIELASDPEVLFDLCRRPRGGWAVLALTEAGLWRAIAAGRPGDACRVGLARTRVWHTTDLWAKKIATQAAMGQWGLIDLELQMGGVREVAELEEVIPLAPPAARSVLAEVLLGNSPQPALEPLPWPVRFSFLFGASRFHQDLANRRDDVAAWFAGGSEQNAADQPGLSAAPSHADQLAAAEALVGEGRLIALTGSAYNDPFEAAIELCTQVLAGRPSDRAIELLEQVIVTEHLVDSLPYRFAAAIHAVALADPGRALELTTLVPRRSQPWNWIPDLLARRERLGGLAERLEEAAREFQRLVPLTSETSDVLWTLHKAVPTLGPLERNLDTLEFYDRVRWLIRLATAEVDTNAELAVSLLHRVLDEPDARLADVVAPLVRLMAADPAAGTPLRDRLLERLEASGESRRDGDDYWPGTWATYLCLAEASEPSVAARLAPLVERLRPMLGPEKPRPFRSLPTSRSDAERRLADAERLLAEADRRVTEREPDASLDDLFGLPWSVLRTAEDIAAFLPEAAVGLVRSVLAWTDRWDREERYGSGYRHLWDDLCEGIGGTTWRLSQDIEQHRHELLLLGIDAGRDCPQYEGATGLGLTAGELETLDPEQALRALGYIFERPRFLEDLTWGAEQTVLDIFDGACLLPIAQDVTDRVELVVTLLQRHHGTAST